MDQQAIKRIRALGLDRVSDDIVLLLESSIEIRTRRVGSGARRILSRIGVLEEPRLDIGVSRIGGLPDLPEGVEWPRWKGTPMSFVAQLNMSAVAAYDTGGLLPHEGILYFFFHMHSQPPTGVCGRVLYYEGSTSLLRRTLPPPELPKQERYIECDVGFSMGTTLPPVDSECIEGLGLTRDERDRYFDVWLKTLSPGTRLLGHSHPVQDFGWMQRDLRTCDDESDNLGAGGWRLLLEVDSDSNAGMMWGDLGMIYYWIRKESLKARDFDSVCVLFQCS